MVSQSFHASWVFWSVNSRRQNADQRDVFFFYVAVISYSNSTFKVKKGEDADDSCPQNLFHSAIYVRSAIKTLADERLLASNLGISFFPSYCFGVAVKGNSIVFETYPRPRRQNFPEISYLGKNRSHLKNQVSPGKLSTSRVYVGKKPEMWPQLISHHF